MKANELYDCEDVLAHLDDYLDQELTREAMGRMLRHLDECMDCAIRCERAYQQLARTRDAVQHFAVPEHLNETIRDAIATDSAG